MRGEGAVARRHASGNGPERGSGIVLDRGRRRGLINAAPRGTSSAGRASPCQGEGRRFEPGVPLHSQAPATTPVAGGLRVPGVPRYFAASITMLRRNGEPTRRVSPGALSPRTGHPPPPGGCKRCSAGRWRPSVWIPGLHARRGRARPVRGHRPRARSGHTELEGLDRVGTAARPSMKPSSRLRRQSRARSLPARTTRTVLAVAPDAETVAALELDLPQAGYAHVVAATGEAAVAILNEEDVDLLLFDLCPAARQAGRVARADPHRARGRVSHGGSGPARLTRQRPCSGS